MSQQPHRHRAVDDVIASVEAGMRFESMELTDADRESLQRVDRGDRTVEQERARLVAELGIDYTEPASPHRVAPQ